MPAGHAGRLVWEPRTDAGRNANVPALPRRTDRHYSAKSAGRAWRGRGGRSARYTRNDARIARALAFIQWHSLDDHLSSCLSVTEPVAFRETESLGRHDASARATRKTNQRKTTKLFSVIWWRRSGVLGAKGARSFKLGATPQEKGCFRKKKALKARTNLGRTAAGSDSRFQR